MLNLFVKIFTKNNQKKIKDQTEPILEPILRTDSLRTDRSVRSARFDSKNGTDVRLRTDSGSTRLELFPSLAAEQWLALNHNSENNESIVTLLTLFFLVQGLILYSLQTYKHKFLSVFHIFA